MRTRRTAPRVAGRRGGSLIEVLTATTVLATGFVGVAGAMSYATKASRLAGDTMVAESVAASVLEQARNEGLGSLQEWQTYAGETNTSGLEEQCSNLLSESRLPSAEAWLVISDVQTNLKGVTVVIMFGEGSQQGRVEAETLLSARF